MVAKNWTCFIGNIMFAILLKPIEVNSKGTYAECDFGQPYCEYQDSSDLTQREDCYGTCQIEDLNNYWGNVSFCCEFHHGQQYPYTGFDVERHCCNNHEACVDNFDQKNVCNNRLLWWIVICLCLIGLPLLVLAFCFCCSCCGLYKYGAGRRRDAVDSSGNSSNVRYGLRSGNVVMTIDGRQQSPSDTINDPYILPVHLYRAPPPSYEEVAKPKQSTSTNPQETEGHDNPAMVPDIATSNNQNQIPLEAPPAYESVQSTNP